jgi:hypothetical protein
MPIRRSSKVSMMHLLPGTRRRPRRALQPPRHRSRPASHVEVYRTVGQQHCLRRRSLGCGLVGSGLRIGKEVVGAEKVAPYADRPGGRGHVERQALVDLIAAIAGELVNEGDDRQSPSRLTSNNLRVWSSMRWAGRAPSPRRRPLSCAAPPAEARFIRSAGSNGTAKCVRGPQGL